jgi:hypothetical protein
LEIELAANFSGVLGTPNHGKQLLKLRSGARRGEELGAVDGRGIVLLARPAALHMPQD